MVGSIDSASNVRVLYTYGAGFPDTSSFNNRPIAVRGIGPDRQYILFNFPLSLMDRQTSFQTLDVALADLGITATDAETSRPTLLQDILDYIYHPNETAPNPTFDTNGDSVIDLRDAVKTINEK